MKQTWSTDEANVFKRHVHDVRCSKFAWCLLDVCL